MMALYTNQFGYEFYLRWINLNYVIEFLKFCDIRHLIRISVEESRWAVSTLDGCLTAASALCNLIVWDSTRDICSRRATGPTGTEARTASSFAPNWLLAFDLLKWDTRATHTPFMILIRAPFDTEHLHCACALNNLSSLHYTLGGSCSLLSNVCDWL